MATPWEAAEIACPFYRTSNKQKREISCEASNPDAAAQVMRFQDNDSYDRQLLIYCSSIKMCQRCEQYRAVKYLKYCGE